MQLSFSYLTLPAESIESGQGTPRFIVELIGQTTQKLEGEVIALRGTGRTDLRRKVSPSFQYSYACTVYDGLAEALGSPIRAFGVTGGGCVT